VSDCTGTTAPDFKLLDANGAVHRMSDFSGQWVLLVFHRYLA
jgi:peroxiredoxin